MARDDSLRQSKDKAARKMAEAIADVLLGVKAMPKRQRVDHKRRLEILQAVPLFAEIRPASLAGLAYAMTEHSIGCDEVLFERGETGTSLFVIVSGAVRVVVGENTVATLGPGDCIGELSVVDGEPRSATIIASEKTLLCEIGGETIFELMRHDVEIARGMFRVIAGRLRAMLDDQQP